MGFSLSPLPDDGSWIIGDTKQYWDVICEHCHKAEYVCKYGEGPASHDLPAGWIAARRSFTTTYGKTMMLTHWFCSLPCTTSGMERIIKEWDDAVAASIKRRKERQ